MAELGRIQDHLLNVGAAALDLGALTGFLYAFNPREKIYDIIAEAFPNREIDPFWMRLFDGSLPVDGVRHWAKRLQFGCLRFVDSSPAPASGRGRLPGKRRCTTSNKTGWSC